MTHVATDNKPGETAVSSRSATTVTMALDHGASLDLVAEAMQRFQRFVEALSVDIVGPATIRWFVEGQVSGGASATFRGEAEREADLVRLVNAFAAVGHALERNESIPYSANIANAARALTELLNGDLTRIRLETRDAFWVVTANALNRTNSELAAFGAVEGRIKTIPGDHQRGFTLFDTLNDEPVLCAIPDDHAGLISDAGDHRVLVEGWIKRDPVSGRPVAIDPVVTITPLPDVPPGSFRRARAILPARAGDPSPESVIRRYRDA